MKTSADSAPRSDDKNLDGDSGTLISTFMRAHVALPHLLTIADAARLLRVHRSTVDRELRAKRLACVRIGRRVLIRPDQLDRYINDRSERHEACHEFLNTRDTGLYAEKTLRPGTFTGADRARDAYNAVQQAQRILRRRKAG